MTATLPAPVHDPEALWTARVAVREAYAKVQRLRQSDPTIRVLVNQLDEIACDLSTEIESAEPELVLLRSA